MKHKTWFRLVVKAIGLLLMGFSLTSLIPGTIHLVVSIVPFLSDEVFGSGVIPLWFNWPYFIGGAVQFAFGLYLFFGGKWIVNKVIPSNRRYCPECGYDLSKSNGANCPECGVALVAGE